MKINLVDWIADSENQPRETMLCYKVFWNQVMFVRDRLRDAIWKDPEQYRKIVYKKDKSAGSLDVIATYNVEPIVSDNDEVKFEVISTHTSKSIKLPVYYINVNKGFEIVMRNNFYDWKVSVISEIPVVDNFYGLFEKNQTISSCYFEGFPGELCFGSYNQNNKKFSVELYTNEELWTFLFLLRNGTFKY